MVDGEDVFIRSVGGERGHWYQAALEAPDQLALIVGRERIPVRAVLDDNEPAIARCSSALQLKYRADPALASMLRPNVLGTTLRLEPR